MIEASCIQSQYKSNEYMYSKGTHSVIDVPGPSHDVRARSRVVQPDIGVDDTETSANGHGLQSIIERCLGMVEVGGRGTKVGKRR
jgi:hypothetical protein